MRKFTSFLIPLCGLALLACKRERIDFGGNDSGSADGVGYLSLEQFSVSVANVVEEISSQPAAATRAAGATTDASDDYKVKIRNTKTDETFEYTYVDLKTAASKRIELTPGIYDVSAESPDLADYLADDATAHWEKPVYSGLVTKTVEKRQETVVDDLLCTLANIKATVALSPDLQAQRRDRTSMYAFYRRMIALRNGSRALTLGRWSPLPCEADGVLSYRMTYGAETAVVFHNASDVPMPFPKAYAPYVYRDPMIPGRARYSCAKRPLPPHHSAVLLQ